MQQQRVRLGQPTDLPIVPVTDGPLHPVQDPGGHVLQPGLEERRAEDLLVSDVGELVGRDQATRMARSNVLRMRNGPGDRVLSPVPAYQREKPPVTARAAEPAPRRA